MFDDDVDTAPAGGRLGVSREVRGVVIEHGLCTEGARLLRFGRSRSRQHACAERARHLNRGLTHAAAAGKHEDDIAGGGGSSGSPRASMCHAVRKVSGKAAAETKSM